MTKNLLKQDSSTSQEEFVDLDQKVKSTNELNFDESKRKKVFANMSSESNWIQSATYFFF